jgi:hypothetical protein
LSVAELEYLRKLDQLKSHNRKLQRELKKGQQQDEEEDEGSSLGPEDSDSEDVEEEEDSDSFIDDQESSSEYVPSQSPSNSAPSPPRKKAIKPRQTNSANSTAARLNRLEMLLTSIGEKVLSPAPGGSAAPPHSQATSGTVSLSSWRTPEGMVGIPEMKREDLLKLPEFEVLERKYTDYCDKAIMNKRTPQPIAQCFSRFLPDLKLSFNSLLSRSEAVRKKFKVQLKHRDYKVTEQVLNDMPTQVFSDLYRELVTSRTFMASELITHLMETPFLKPTGEKLTLTALVLQASTAFRERLDSCPTQTVNRCTPVQFRDAFVKMVLGPDDRHLADFLHCDNWDEAAGAMMDLEGTGQGVTFMKKVHKRVVSTGKPEESASSPSQSLSRQDTRTTKGDKDWERIYRELSSTIEHNDTEMKGHTHTFRDRAKRLMQLRDNRAREAELLRLERSMSSASGEGNTSTTQLRHQLQQQQQASRPQQRHTDHRDYGDGSSRPHQYFDRQERRDRHDGSAEMRSAEMRWREQSPRGTTQGQEPRVPREASRERPPDRNDNNNNANAPNRTPLSSVVASRSQM